MADIYSNLQNLIDNTLELLEKYKKATDDFLALADTTTNAKIAEINSTAAARLTDINNKAKEITDNLELIELSTVAMSEAEYRARQRQNKQIYAGNGFIKWGGAYGDHIINEGMWTHDNIIPDKRNEVLHLGRRPTDAIFQTPESGLSYNKNEEIPTVIIDGVEITIIQNRNLFTSNPDTGNDYDAAVIQLPKPATLKGVINSISTIEIDLNLGDFAYVKDVNYNYIVNGTFETGVDGWSISYPTSGAGELIWDSENLRMGIKITNTDYDIYGYQEFYPIRGAKYILSFDYDGDFDKVEITYANYNILEDTGSRMTIELEPNTTACQVRFRPTRVTDSVLYIDNASLTLAEPTLITSTGNIQAGDTLNNVTNSALTSSTEFIGKNCLVLMEYEEHDVLEEDFVAPYGFMQYVGTIVRVTDNEGNQTYIDSSYVPEFDGADKLSLYGTWQQAGDVVARGMKWSTLTVEEKRLLLSDPRHLLFVDADGSLRQGRWKFTVLDNLTNITSPFHNEDNMPYMASVIPIGTNLGGCKDFRFKLPYTNKGESASDTNFFGMFAGNNIIIAKYNDEYITGPTCTYAPSLLNYAYGQRTYFVQDPDARLGTELPDRLYLMSKKPITSNATPIALITRLNDGIYHEVYNPLGTAVAYSKDENRILNFNEYALDDNYISSIEDCFDPSKIAAKTEDGNIVPADDSSALYRSGSMYSGLSGHPHGIYCDQVHWSNVKDLRMNAKQEDPVTIIRKMQDAATLSKIRGSEIYRKLKYLTTITMVGGVSIGTSNRLVINFSVEETLTKKIYGRFDNIVLVGDNGKVLELKRVVESEIFLYMPYSDNKVMYLYGYGDPVTAEKISEFFPAGTNIDIYTRTKDYYTPNLYKNYIAPSTCVIGHPLPLEKRVSYTISSTSENINVEHNDYILCSDSTDNNGAVGHVYRYLGSSITNVATNDSSVGTANTSDGHIDLSDTTLWLDLGSNLTLGGYPSSWFNGGLSAKPHLTNDAGDSNLPIDVEQYDSYNRLLLRVPDVFNNIVKVYIRDKSNQFVEIQYGISNTTWGTAYSGKGIYVPLDIYSELGYSSVEEMKDLMLVYVSYYGYTRFTRQYGMMYSNKGLATLGTAVYLAGDKRHDDKSTDVLCYSLIRKKTTTTVDNSINLGLVFEPETTYGTLFSTASGYSVKHEDVNNYEYMNYGGNINSPLCKALPLLREYDCYGKAYIFYLFKELKWSTDNTSWGDDQKIQYYGGASAIPNDNGEMVLYGSVWMPTPYYSRMVRGK